MIGLDLGNYNTIVARQVGNETTTLQDPTGLRQIPSTIKYGDVRTFKSRSSKSESNFIYQLERAQTVNEQIDQISNIYQFMKHLKSDMNLANSVIATYPAHFAYQTRSMYSLILNQLFQFNQLVPQHLSIASQYYFRRFSDFQKKPVKFAFIQINEFDVVYSSFLLFQKEIKTLHYKTLQFGSSEFDELVYRICCKKNERLLNMEMSKSLQEIKRAKITLSLGQNATVAFPDFDVSLTNKEFQQEFEKYQQQILQMIEPDVHAIELLGGGCRLLNLPKHLQIKQTKRLNPDETCAQGAIIFYLLTSTKKLLVKDIYVSQRIYLNDTQMLKAGEIYPVVKETSFSPLDIFNLRLENGFILTQLKQKSKKFSFSTKFKVKIDQYLNFEVENPEYEVVFKCIDGQDVIQKMKAKDDEFSKIEEEFYKKLQEDTKSEPMEEELLQSQLKANEEKQRLEEERQIEQAENMKIQEEIQQFFADLQNGQFDKFLTVEDQKQLNNVMKKDFEAQKEHYDQICLVKQRKQNYENWREQFGQLEKWAKEKLEQETNEKEKKQFAVEKYLKQLREKLEYLEEYKQGYLIVADLLDQKFIEAIFE
uniref:Uncharacterized protein n=1 Tax=Trepomonas sp. PC1 TaxID=1076344 RepID=A0A146KFI5_9EUKA|eukprot:JAP94938.1 hypothetical protein TPC1_12222 [Trepomonas sp. PC1]